MKLANENLAIIFVNDDETAAFVTSVAEQAGLFPTRVYGSEEALKIAEEKSVAVALVDIEIPECEASGPEMSVQLYDSYGTQCVLLLNSQPSTEEERRKDGERVSSLQSNYFFHDYFYKQSNPNLLVSCLVKLKEDNRRFKRSNLWADRLVASALRQRQVSTLKSLDDAPAIIAINPELLDSNAVKNEDYVRFQNIDAVLGGSERAAIGVIFHSLSPAGDGFSLAASIGRDLLVSNCIGLKRLRYCLQGPVWSSLNHSIKRIVELCPNVDVDSAVEKCRDNRISFLRIFDKSYLEPKSKKFERQILENLPLVEAKVIDLGAGHCVDSIVVVDEWLKHAVELLRTRLDTELGDEVDRAEFTRKLDLLEKDFAHFSNKQMLTEFGYGQRTAEMLVKGLKGLLNVGQLSEDSLRYYFIQNRYLVDRDSKVIRIGPIEERNWDVSYEQFMKNEPDRKYGGVYFQEHKMSEQGGLPYSFVSGNVLNAIQKGAMDWECMLFVDSPRNVIENAIAKCSPIELRRMLHDLIAFCQFAEFFDPKFSEPLAHLPKQIYGKENSQIIPGSQRYLAWIKNSLFPSDRKKNTLPPAPLTPFLLTDLELGQLRHSLTPFFESLGSTLSARLSTSNADLLRELDTSFVRRPHMPLSKMGGEQQASKCNKEIT